MKPGIRAQRLVVALFASSLAASAALGACNSKRELPPLKRPSYGSGAGGSGGSNGSGNVGGIEVGGPIPDPLAPCDADIDIAENDARVAARALELCSDASASSFGVVGAKWTLVDGNDIGVAPNYEVGHGVVSGFGALAVKHGARMLALSSGMAREFSLDPQYVGPIGFIKGYEGQSPDGFPKPAPACPGVTTGTPNDGVALEVTLKAPAEAVGFAFDFNFLTYEWPTFICSEYNDYFVAILSPAPTGHADGNVSFDSQGNPVSVNNAFLRACGCELGPPCIAGVEKQKQFACELGTSMLQGTGFEPGAATGWLVTTAPAPGGETVTLRLAVYDSGDGQPDSTTVIDSFRWLGGVDAGVSTLPEDAEVPK